MGWMMRNAPASPSPSNSGELYAARIAESTAVWGILSTAQFFVLLLRQNVPLSPFNSNDVERNSDVLGPNSSALASNSSTREADLGANAAIANLNCVPLWVFRLFVPFRLLNRVPFRLSPFSTFKRHRPDDPAGWLRRWRVFA